MNKKKIPVYLTVVTLILVVAAGFAGDATLGAIVWRALLAGIIMFLAGKTAILFLKAAWEQASTTGSGQRINTQIDDSLEQALANDPERVAELTKKMDIGSYKLG